MTIYLDVLFVLNAFMDYTTLLAAGRLGGLRVRRTRLVLAAVAGGVYAISALLLPLFGRLPFRLLACAGLCRLAFARQGSFVRICLLYIIVSAAFAGLALAVGAAAGRQLLCGAGYYFAVPLRALLLVAALGYALSGLLLRGDARHGALQHEMETLTVRFMEKEHLLPVLRDTGNTLIEPVSGRPVIVVECGAAIRILGNAAGVLRGLTEANAAELLPSLPAGIATRFGLLPFQAVGTGGGLLLYFRPDAVLRAGGQPLDCVLAISPQQVGTGGCEGLIGI